VCEPYQEHERFQNFGVAQRRVAYMFLFGFAIFLDHGFDFGGDPALRIAGHRLFIDETRVRTPFVAFRQGGERTDQILIVQVTVTAGRFRQRKSQAHEQVLFFIHELIGDFDLQK